MIVRDFQTVIGKEARGQIKKAAGRLPDLLIACVGGGSNAMGLFYPFINDKDVEMVGVEAGGYGIRSGSHAATICGGKVGVLHGSKSYLLEDKYGQITEAHSISAGLDYPGVGPEHSYLNDTGRVSYTSITDKEALKGFKELTLSEGIIPALESSHAIAYTLKRASEMKKDEIIITLTSQAGAIKTSIPYLRRLERILNSHNLLIQAGAAIKTPEPSLRRLERILNSI